MAGRILLSLHGASLKLIGRVEETGNLGSCFRLLQSCHTVLDLLPLNLAMNNTDNVGFVSFY